MNISRLTPNDDVCKSSTFLMLERHGYSVRFSSLNPNLLIVGTSQTYGKRGRGTLYLLRLLSDGRLICLQTFEWTDGLFDVAWCQGNSEIVCSASGDGSIQLWNINNSSAMHPLLCYKEHSKEASCVDWSSHYVNTFLTSSWDCTIKIWDSLFTKSLSTFHGHSQLVNSAKFSPHLSNIFASVSADGYLKLWSTNWPTNLTTLKSHNSEALTCDWNPINPNVLATGGSDGLIRVWDIRYFSAPLFEIVAGCTAVRRIRFSYQKCSVLASVSYDGITRIWDLEQGLNSMEKVESHFDCAFGLDWNPFRNNQLVDCGWDSFVNIFTSVCDLRRKGVEAIWRARFREILSYPRLNISIYFEKLTHSKIAAICYNFQHAFHPANVKTGNGINISNG